MLLNFDVSMQERADVLEQLGELKNQGIRQLNVLLLGVHIWSMCASVAAPV